MTVAVGTPLAELDAEARPGEAHPTEHNGRRAPSPDQPAHDEAQSPTTNAIDGATDRSRFYSPVVRRIATKHDVDLSQVRGTGVGGRVRKRDVLAYLTEEGGREVPHEPALHIESPYRPEGEVARELIGATRREPMTTMRQAIARHMVESRRTAAHCTTIVEADFARVTVRRRELREPMARRGVNLTYLAFVARATVEALGEHPKLNASVDGDEILYHEDVNLGIAVALDDGLIVPVIRRAQRLSLEGIAVAIGDLAERARGGQLQPDEVHGGTFTITNPGQFGAVLATPIINQPQVAILDLEAIVKRPIVIDAPRLLGSPSGDEAVTEEVSDSIVIHPMSYLCMSWDHRALDGADAARFLASVKGRLEAWEVGT
jgi:2-oxoglutarate dehydrogenase E2 component (dihydrolipoamide succinyltransferase)